MDKMDRRQALATAAALGVAPLAAIAATEPPLEKVYLIDNTGRKALLKQIAKNKRRKEKRLHSVIWCLHRAGGIPLPLAEVCAEAMKTNKPQPYHHEKGGEIPLYYFVNIQDGENTIDHGDALRYFSFNYPRRVHNFMAHSEGALVNDERLAPDEPFISGTISWHGIESPRCDREPDYAWTAMLVTLRTDAQFDGFEMFNVPQWWREDL